MRCSFRFFSSCSSSSFMAVRVRFSEQKVLMCNTPENHPFHAVQIVKPVLRCFGDGGEEWLAWILLQQPEQLAHGKRRHFAAFLFECRDVSGKRRHSLEQCLFCRVRIASLDTVSAGRLVLGQCDANLL